MEAESRKQLENYLDALRVPCSFVAIQQMFPDSKGAEIASVIEEMKKRGEIWCPKELCKIQQRNTISMFMSKNVKCESVRMEYIEVSAHPLDASLPLEKENVAVELHEEEKIEYKTHEDLNDEKLLDYKISLLKEKAREEAHKQKLNTKNDKIKKIMQFNEIKEVACEIFQKIANMKKSTIKEICGEFGVDLAAV